MNYLIQAYACSPDKGGEFAVSWGWIVNLDKAVSDNDKIYVISLTLKSKQVEKYKLKHVELLIIKDLDKIEFLSRTPFYYIMWQKIAYKTVKQSGIHFDIIHVYSLSDFRQPGLWYKFKESYTIFGPVGGGQSCPKGLISYDDKSHIIRNLVNLSCKLNPIFHKKIKGYKKIYACNSETSKYLKNAEVLIDVPLNHQFYNMQIIRGSNQKPVVLFCGRLINKKGLLFLLDVIIRIPVEIQFELHVYGGDGEQKELILDRIKKLNLSNRVIFKGKLPYERMSEAYNSADIFVLPSLRESGGNVLVEAMAHSLPIVSLNMSFSKVLNEQKAGLFVNTKQSKEKIIDEYAHALIHLLEDKKLRIELGKNGYKYVNNNLTWEQMINRVYGVFLK